MHEIKETRRGFLQLIGVVVGVLAFQYVPGLSLIEKVAQDSGAFTPVGWFEYPPLSDEERERQKQRKAEWKAENQDSGVIFGEAPAGWFFVGRDAVDSFEIAKRLLDEDILHHHGKVGPCWIFPHKLSREEFHRLAKISGKALGLWQTDEPQGVDNADTRG